MALSMCGETIDSLELYRQNSVAINVKVYRALELSPSVLEKLAPLSARVRQKLMWYAESSILDGWWQDMGARAAALDLGRISSAGRSGGWLVFEFSSDHLFGRIAAAEEVCANCERTFEVHLEGKCTFDASMFRPEYAAPLAFWRNLKTFTDEVTLSLTQVGQGFDTEVLFQLENLDDDFAAGPVSALGDPGPDSAEESPETEGDAGGRGSKGYGI